jgi:hypothetical protein
VPVLGFLHTSPVHVGPFDLLVADLAPGWRAVHVVDESLLNDARTRGEVDAEIVARLKSRFAELQAESPDVIVCTCSTIGEASEQLGALRVDRPMAVEAVSLACAGNGAILVVASLASTVAPTKALIDDEFARAAQRTLIAAVSEGLERANCQVLVVEEAWAFFERGDSEGYVACLANAIRTHITEMGTGFGSGPEIIVLAQASMRDVPVLLADLGIPVRTSPALAVITATSLC